ncbi:MAG: metallophosphoesterase family protein [Phycisphaerae bacterium]
MVEGEFGLDVVMRTFVIGDVHGCLGALDAVLDAVGPTGEDRVIGLGDFIDRGPDSKGVIERLMGLQRAGMFTGILGNHEEMALAAREGLKRPGELGLPGYHDWLVFGGYEMVRSYGGVRGSVKDVPEEHWGFMRGLLPYVELRGHILVHAMARHDVPMEGQTGDWLRWQRFRDPLPHASGKVIVCGHTKGRAIRNVGHAVCIDTGVYEGGWLTCLELETGRVVQGNERGKVERSHIDDWRQK